MICDVCNKSYNRRGKNKRYVLIEGGQKFETYCCKECAAKTAGIEFIKDIKCKRCGKQLDSFENVVFDAVDLYCSLDCALYDNGIYIDNGEFDDR